MSLHLGLCTYEDDAWTQRRGFTLWDSGWIRLKGLLKRDRVETEDFEDGVGIYIYLHTSIDLNVDIHTGIDLELDTYTCICICIYIYIHNSNT